MNINTPLTPHLEQFIRDQLASGRFHTEADLVRAALGLLEDHCHSRTHSAFRLQSHLDPARTGAPAEVTVNVDRFPADHAATTPTEKRCPRGILADLRSGITADEIKQARREMWAGLAQGED